MGQTRHRTVLATEVNSRSRSWPVQARLLALLHARGQNPRRRCGWSFGGLLWLSGARLPLPVEVHSSRSRSTIPKSLVQTVEAAVQTRCATSVRRGSHVSFALSQCRSTRGGLQDWLPFLWTLILVSSWVPCSTHQRSRYQWVTYWIHDVHVKLRM